MDRSWYARVRMLKQLRKNTQPGKRPSSTQQIQLFKTKGKFVARVTHCYLRGKLDDNRIPTNKDVLSYFYYLRKFKQLTEFGSIEAVVNDLLLSSNYKNNMDKKSIKRKFTKLLAD